MDGILIVDKPKGITSHDVVDFVRRRFDIEKAGHAGTLDPAATGVLVILIGKATKLSAKFTGSDKEYEAVMALGKKTDSGDSEGKVLSEKDCRGIEEERIRQVFRSFEGETEQIPPMVSAIRYISMNTTVRSISTRKKCTRARAAMTMKSGVPVRARMTASRDVTLIFPERKRWPGGHIGRGTAGSSHRR